MSLTSNEERRTRVAEDAANWLLRLESGQLDVAARGEFIDWLRESPLHVAEMLRIGAVHGALTDFKGWEQVASVDPSGSGKVVELPMRMTPGPVQMPVATRWPKKMAGLLAASLTLLVVGVLWRDQAQNHIQTRQGEYREIKLADGTLLEVAPDSELHLNLGQRQRRVVLDRGEALFHVARDATRPFIVAAGQTAVRAVGTAFSVNRAADSVVVTVAEGKVAVTVAKPPGQATHAMTNQADAQVITQVITLGADQQLSIASSDEPAALRTVNSQTELAWARGLLIFDGETVAQVVQRFNLSNRVQLQILDQRLATRPVSGVFNASDPLSFVAFLETVAGVASVQDESEILIGAADGAQKMTTDRTVATVP